MIQGNHCNIELQSLNQRYIPGNCLVHIIGPGSHIEYPTGTKNSNFVEDHPRNIPTKFGSNRPSGLLFNTLKTSFYELFLILRELISKYRHQR
jgi:hypothetical protein